MGFARWGRLLACRKLYLFTLCRVVLVRGFLKIIYRWLPTNKFDNRYLMVWCQTLLLFSGKSYIELILKAVNSSNCRISWSNCQWRNCSILGSYFEGAILGGANAGGAIVVFGEQVSADQLSYLRNKFRWSNCRIFRINTGWAIVGGENVGGANVGGAIVVFSEFIWAEQLSAEQMSYFQIHMGWAIVGGANVGGAIVIFSE